ncbi:PQQ-binding-like beta-propeller repeat protein [Streptomyces sp. NBC_00470]|uniref:outer membrane protein assembly factor BamB family protein n=1 Tax=Streptomyces sp. NBC_00470 TaxID=2975753 RepID=UPI002F915E70
MTTPGYYNGRPPAPGQQPHSAPYPPRQARQAYPAHQQFVPPQFMPGPLAPKKKRGQGLTVFLLVLSIMVSGLFGSVAWILLDPTKSSVEWSLPYYGGAGDTQNYLGTWFVGDTVVRAQTDGVSALDTDSGELQWGLAAPGKGASTICHASSVSSNGVAVLATGAVHDCDTLFALDLKTGKKLWQHTSKQDGDPATAVSDGTVVVNDKTAYDLRTGKQLWKDSKNGTYDGKPCKGQGYVGGRQLVRVQLCTTHWTSGVADQQASATAGVDPATGKAKWTYAMGDGEWDYGEDATIVSTSPTIVRVPQEVKKNGFTVLRDNGEVRSDSLVLGPAGTYRGGESFFAQREGATAGDPEAAMKVIGNTLYIAEHHTDNGLDTAVDAYSLDSGKRLWTTGDQTEVEYSLVQGSGNELLALKHDDSGWREDNFGGDGKPAYLVSLDPTTGAESQRAAYGHLDKALGLSTWAMPYMHDGTLFLASVANSDKGELKKRDQHESALLKMGD